MRMTYELFFLLKQKQIYIKFFVHVIRERDLRCWFHEIDNRTSCRLCHHKISFYICFLISSEIIFKKKGAKQNYCLVSECTPKTRTVSTDNILMCSLFQVLFCTLACQFTSTETLASTFSLPKSRNIICTIKSQLLSFQFILLILGIHSVTMSFRNVYLAKLYGKNCYKKA